MADRASGTSRAFVAITHVLAWLIAILGMVGALGALTEPRPSDKAIAGPIMAFFCSVLSGAFGLVSYLLVPRCCRDETFAAGWLARHRAAPLLPGALLFVVAAVCLVVLQVW